MLDAGLIIPEFIYAFLVAGITRFLPFFLSIPQLGVKVLLTFFLLGTSDQPHARVSPRPATCPEALGHPKCRGPVTPLTLALPNIRTIVKV